PEQQEVFLSTGDGVEWWNYETGQKIRDLPIRFVSHMLFTPDHQRMILADSSTIKICELNTGTVTGEMQLPVDRSTSLALHPSGNQLAVAAGNQVKLFDLTT
ncbi:MAG TPA: hypothetical protein PKA06_12810, partial [Gemmatales bacterium]|nr:hypothetical protein [Gemmatales bacterium]